jgi:ubiquinone biosynthesis protein
VFTTLASIARLTRVGFVLAREGALALVDPAALPGGPARWGLALARLIERRNAGASAERLAAALTRLGPSHVKFGQFLATRPDVVGQRVAADLSLLQDRMPPFPTDVARRTVEASLGKRIADVFTVFDEPVAAASISQVHPALTKAGRKVAVKVLRPQVRERFSRDLRAMRRGAELAEQFSPEAKRLRITGVVDTLIRSVTMEMDLRLEAAALSELAQNTAADSDFRVPKPDWELTGRDILVAEWIDHHVGMASLAPAPATSVGKRSTCDANCCTTRPCGTPGPARRRGTLIAPSYRFFLPKMPCAPNSSP